MPDGESTPSRTDPRRLTIPLLVLAVFVVLSVVVGVGWMCYEYFTDYARPRRGSSVMVMSLALVMGGLSAAAIMVGLAAAIRYAHRLNLAMRRIEDQDKAGGTEGRGPSDDPTAAWSRADSEMMVEMLRLIREISDNTLLVDEQKESKLKRLRDAERQESAHRIEELIGQGNYHLAREVCQEMVSRFGSDARTNELAGLIEQASAAAEADDLALAHRKVKDLMSISAWERAEQVAGELVAKHPDNPQARGLPKLVTRERETFEQQQRRRMYADVEKQSSRRQWKEALDAARLLIDRYPDSPEAETVGATLETLEANAEIQERQELESRIKGLIKGHRFAEAVDLARQVIQTYPDSPQAEVLRSQLDRLEKKAKEA